MSTSAPSGTDQWGPAVVGGRPRRHRIRRVTVVLAVILVTWVLVLAGAGVYANTRMTRTDVEGLGAGGGPLQVLVIGSDSREDLTEEQRRELHTGSAPGTRTDTIMLLTIEGGRVATLAFPRDLLVTRCDGTRGRINTAVGIGGEGCLVQTITDLTGITIDHFVSVDFLGFRDIVDAVGGVELCLEEPIADEDAGIDLPAGCQVLDGRQALGYVRVRKIDSDLERIERQQRFLRALAGEVVSPVTVVDPFRLYRTAGRVGGALTTDSGMGPLDLGRLGWGMWGMAGGDAVTETVPAEPATVGGAAVLRPSDDEAAALFARFGDGSILDQAGAPLPPDEVTVSVLNGTRISGLARRMADELRAAGFAIADVGDADAPVDASVIRYPRGQRDAAETLARSLPREVPLEEASVGTVTLILGPDLAGEG